MAERGIIFSAPMVRALLDGRKAQTRRLLKVPAQKTRRGEWFAERLGEGLTDGAGRPFADRACLTHSFTGACVIPPHAIGDRLYVREAWRPHYLGDGVWDLDVSYAADGARRTIKDGEFGDKDWTWPKAADRGNVPSIHMPRWASRLTLTVTDVRVQRLQEISKEDAEAEGCVWDSADGLDVWYVPGAQMPRHGATARECFSILWNSLHAKPGERWEDDPWLYALSFTVEHRNIDEETDHG